jgi:hypothetical protein
LGFPCKGGFKLTEQIATAIVARNEAKLSLDLPGIRDILPFFECGDFALLHGSRSISMLSSWLCIKAQLPTQIGGLASRVLFVDCGNSFRLYQVSRLAQLQRLNPTEVLNHIHIARAFTAYQMIALTTEKLQQALIETDAKFIIVSDVAATFLDDDLHEDEAQKVYSRAMTFLAELARKKHLVVIATYLPHESTRKNSLLYASTYQKANVVASLAMVNHRRTMALEKHSTYLLGSAEFPSDQITLPDLWRAVSDGKNS